MREITIGRQQKVNPEPGSDRVFSVPRNESDGTNRMRVLVDRITRHEGKLSALEGYVLQQYVAIESVRVGTLNPKSDASTSRSTHLPRSKTKCIRRKGLFKLRVQLLE